MSACKFSQELIASFHDGESGARTSEVERHLEGCASCRQVVAGLAGSAEGLRRLVDAGVGAVEPLVALAKIRQRIERYEQESLRGRLSTWWQELWLFHRRAAAGVALAAALGALSAPLAVYLGGSVVGPSSGMMAGVVIESMEWEGDSRAVVYQGGGGATTLIWVEPNGLGKQQQRVQ